MADGNTLYQKRMKEIAIFSSNVPADYDMESPDFPFRRPVVSENGAACLQRGRNRRFRRKKWAVAEAAARSYDRTAVSPCFLTIDCISRMTEGPVYFFGP